MGSKGRQTKPRVNEYETGQGVTVQVEVGQLVGDYEILSVAGVGGMGIVYKARQRSLGRVVALKVIREEIARTPEYRDRFLREARLAASVDHPHVVSVYDVGDLEDRLFLAMQWIDGQDLKRAIGHSGRLAPERAVSIACQLAGALDAVHSVAGLVHRDVKPANVMLRQMGGRDHAYLTDFGVAKPSQAADHLTQTGSVVGTTGYLSPEQIRGQEPGPRSDLYALGCLFFEALTGRPPFHGENEMALRWAHANDPRPTASSVIPDLGSRYDEFLSVALAVDPGQRFGSGREFATALAAAQSAPADAAAATTIIATHAPTAVGPPTPAPAPVNTPQPPVPMYQPGYPYGTPPPAYPQPSRSGNPLALILLGVVALAGIAVGALAATGVFSHSGASVSTTTTQVAFRSDTRTTSPHVTHVKRPPVVVTKTARSAPPTTLTPTSGITSCAGDVTVGPNTSCGFGENVEQAYDEGGGGDTAVSAYSPATGATYTIDCTGGVPHVCTGGTTHDASVYFTSGPTSGQPVTPETSSTASPIVPPGNLRACDQNISAGPVTSCSFAENVFVAYYDDYKANGVQSTNAIEASSPVTHQSYTMDCSTDDVTVNCTGGTNSFVTFPLHAVEVYSP
jgi:serine/threonine protein kinase